MVVPLIPIIVVLAVNYEAYLGRKAEGYCWLDVSISYWSFLIPVAVILLVNFVVFVRVLWNITHRPKGLQSNQSDTKTELLINVNAGIACMLLLGLTWVFGYLLLIEGDLANNASDRIIVFAYIFTILNTLHGFFIFLFFTLRDKKVRNHWRQLMCKKRTKSHAKYSTDPIPGSKSKGTDSSNLKNETMSETKDMSEDFIDEKSGSYNVSMAYGNPKYNDEKLD